MRVGECDRCGAVDALYVSPVTLVMRLMCGGCVEQVEAERADELGWYEEEWT